MRTLRVMERPTVNKDVASLRQNFSRLPFRTVAAVYFDELNKTNHSIAGKKEFGDNIGMIMANGLTLANRYAYERLKAMAEETDARAPAPDYQIITNNSSPKPAAVETKEAGAIKAFFDWALARRPKVIGRYVTGNQRENFSET